MSVRILNIGLSQPDNNKGYLEHAKSAGDNCLANSDVGKDEIDLLINVGNYRDNNMCEPSMAVLIQHELGINLNPLTHPVKAHTFSFDLLNGAGGLLNALQVADAILSTKGGRYALLVSGDSHPSTKEHPDFPFNHSSAAVLIERVNTGGFAAFAFKTSDEFQGNMGYLDLDIHGLQSRTSVIVEGTSNGELTLQLATDVVREYIQTHTIDTENTLLLALHTDAQFAQNLSQNVNIPLATQSTKFSQLHTAGIGFALEELLKENVTSNILCVVISSGITIGCTLYQQVD